MQRYNVTNVNLGLNIIIVGNRCTRDTVFLKLILPTVEIAISWDLILIIKNTLESPILLRRIFVDTCQRHKKRKR